MSIFLFVTINLINLFAILFFVSKFRWPSIEHLLGAVTLLLAIPAAIIGVVNLMEGRWFFTWLPALLYVVWAAFDLVVDHVVRVEFRNPFRPSIGIPFLLLYYFSIGGMAASLYSVNIYLWIFSGATCLLNVYASFYAASHGKGNLIQLKRKG